MIARHESDNEVLYCTSSRPSTNIRDPRNKSAEGTHGFSGCFFSSGKINLLSHLDRYRKVSAGLASLISHSRPPRDLARHKRVTQHAQVARQGYTGPVQLSPIMAPEEDLKKRVGRRLTKRRKEGHQLTMEIPDRFRDGDDAEEDCTAPGASGAQFLNQSVFGMIAAAGSQVDFNARFDGGSSDEEDEPTGSPSRHGTPDLVADKKHREAVGSRKHSRKFSERGLLKSMPRLSLRSPSKSKSPQPDNKPFGLVESSTGSPMASPTLPQPRTPVARTTPKDTMVMSRMLDAKAQLAERPSFDVGENETGRLGTMETSGTTAGSLANRLKEIFEFDEPEDVIEGMYATW